MPATHIEFMVQRSPSSQVVPSGLFGWTHTPTALHWSLVHTLPSSAHGNPITSNVHVAEQQSPLLLLPSSHCSGPSGIPLPQKGVRVGVADGVAVAVNVAVEVKVRVLVEVG